MILSVIFLKPFDEDQENDQCCPLSLEYLK